MLVAGALTPTRDDLRASVGVITSLGAVRNDGIEMDSVAAVGRRPLSHCNGLDGPSGRRVGSLLIWSSSGFRTSYLSFASPAFVVPLGLLMADHGRLALLANLHEGQS